MSYRELHLWVFPTIHEILALEDSLKVRGIWYDLLPKPTTISSDCGVVLATLPEESSSVEAILTEHGHSLTPALYHSSTLRYSVENRSRSTTKATPEQGPLGQ